MKFLMNRLFLFMFLFSFFSKKNKIVAEERIKRLPDSLITERCLKEKLGDSLVIETEKDIKNALMCVSSNDSKKWIGLSAPKEVSKYVSNKKAILINGIDNQLVSHFTFSEIKHKLGSVWISFDNDDQKYIASEAPFDAELFLNMMWDNNIHSYISLTNGNDNNENKLRFIRGLGTNRVDLHHLLNLFRSSVNGFKVYKPVLVEKTKYLKVYRAKIEHNGEIREFVHFMCDTWEDHDKIDIEQLSDIINKVEKHKNPGPLFVNCFSGVGRTRAVILGIHIKQLFNAKKDFDIERENIIFGNLNYSKMILNSIGDPSGSFGKKRKIEKNNVQKLKEYYKTLVDRK